MTENDIATLLNSTSVVNTSFHQPSMPDVTTSIRDYPHLTIVQSSDASGLPNDLSQKQFETLILFKRACLAENLLPNFDYFDDYYLLKFCRAKKFKLEKILAMFRNYMEWRRRERVDEIDSFDFHELSEVKKIYPHAYHNMDKEGHPVYIEQTYKIDIEKLFKVTDEKRLIRYYILLYEQSVKYRYAACSKAKGKRIDTGLNILDVNGIGITDILGKHKEFLGIASQITQDYYPENMFRMFLVNAGTFFGLVWTLAKGFMDKKMADKVEVLGSNYSKKLLKYINAEDLPEFLGGTCTCSHCEGGCMWSDVGPWNIHGNRV